MAAPLRAETLRVALFHTELDRDGPGLLLRDILKDDDEQVQAVLTVLRHVDADILVLSGIDYDHRGLALGALADRLPGYVYRFALPPNRGRPSGLDLDGDGRIGGAGDETGFAAFAGAGGLAVLSRRAILRGGVQDRTAMPWGQLPVHLAPDAVSGEMALSTTAHWTVPIDIGGGQTLSLVVWHATPPVFDGPEDRNGRRNHDETRLAHLMAKEAVGPVILAGLTNLDPVDGEGRVEAMAALLNDPAFRDPRPGSVGAVLASERDGGANLRQRGDAALDTVDWPDGANRPGNLRTDLLLPSIDLKVSAAGVFWPPPDALLSSEVERASRHRVVWIDLVTDGGGDGDQRRGLAKAGD